MDEEELLKIRIKSQTDRQKDDQTDRQSLIYVEELRLGLDDLVIDLTTRRYKTIILHALYLYKSVYLVHAEHIKFTS